MVQQIHTHCGSAHCAAIRFVWRLVRITPKLLQAPNYTPRIPPPAHSTKTVASHPCAPLQAHSASYRSEAPGMLTFRPTTFCSASLARSTYVTVTGCPFLYENMTPPANTPPSKTSQVTKVIRLVSVCSTSVTYSPPQLPNPPCESSLQSCSILTHEMSPSLDALSAGPARTLPQTCVSSAYKQTNSGGTREATTGNKKAMLRPTARSHTSYGPTPSCQDCPSPYKECVTPPHPSTRSQWFSASCSVSKLLHSSTHPSKYLDCTGAEYDLHSSPLGSCSGVSCPLLTILSMSPKAAASDPVLPPPAHPTCLIHE
mmetsp:Transcript_38072/g.88894  ORF Transcript_38072/g.88894 Transcript_38072/m.88894 type:complete len:314 (-) Transcript_38072:490-1431(-)